MAASVVAPLLIAAGFAVVVGGLRRERAGLGLPVTEPGKALAMARALRTTILGLALVGVAAGWLWHVRPLLIVSLVIAAEEMLEITVVAGVLGDYVRARAAATPPGPRSAPALPPSARRR